MFRKTLLVSIIFMIFAFSKSELVVSRATMGGDVVKNKSLNCTQYGAYEVEGGCECPTSFYFMGTCTHDEQIGCQTEVFGDFWEGKLHSMDWGSRSSLGINAVKAGKGIILGYVDGGECNKLDDIFLWNTGASGISGDWVNITSEGGKLWDNKLGYLVEINSDDMAGQIIKVVPASGCVNITCALVVFSGDVSYPVDIQKLQIKETSAPVTSAPVTSAPVTSAPVTSAPVTSAPVTSAPVTSAPITSPTPAPESNACGQFTPRYEYILAFLVLALAVITSG